MTHPELQKMADLDRMIHEPARLMILTVLSTVNEADFLFLMHNTGLTRGNLSAHLSKLEAAGYINIQKTFRGKMPQTLLSLTPQGQTAYDAYRKQLSQIVQALPGEK
jgi:DNA-binding MarR family transcriptional regulator